MNVCHQDTNFTKKSKTPKAGFELKTEKI